MATPKFTVLYNSPGAMYRMYKFFMLQKDAQQFYDQQIIAGTVPTLRRFYEQDRLHGPIDPLGGL